MEVENTENSSDIKAGSEVDLQDMNEELENDVSKARWDAETGMAEVIEKKGGIWATMGIVRGNKLYCSIEETLFLVERGELLLFDVNDTNLSMVDICEMVARNQGGFCWELLNSFKHLKSLDYIVVRHGVPWTLENDENGCESTHGRGTRESNGVSDQEMEVNISISSLLRSLQINEMKPTFDVYLPDNKFSKSSPGDPNFVLFLSRGLPPSKLEIENLEKRYAGLRIKFCHVADRHVSFFSFQKAEVPVLP